MLFKLLTSAMAVVAPESDVVRRTLAHLNKIFQEAFSAVKLH